MLNNQEKFEISQIFITLTTLMRQVSVDYFRSEEQKKSYFKRKSEEIEEIFEKVKIRGEIDEETEKIKQNTLKILERMIISQKTYWEDLFIPDRIEQLEKDKEAAELEAKVHLEAIERGEEWGKNQVSKLEADKEVLSDTILQKNEELKNQDQEIWELKEKNQALDEQIGQKIQTIADLETENEELDVALSDRLNERDARPDITHAELTQKYQTIINLTTELAGLEAIANDYYKTSQAQQKSLITQKENLEKNKKQQKNWVNQQVKIQSKRYRKLVKNTKKLAIQKTYFANQHDLQRQTINDLQIDLNQTQTDLNTLLAHRYDLYLQLAQFNGEITQLNTQLEKKEQKIERLTKRLENTQKKLNRTKQYQQNQDQNQRRRLQSANQRLEQEKGNLETKLFQKIFRLTSEQAKTQNLTKIKKVKSISAQKLRIDLDKKEREVNSLTGQNNYWVKQDDRLRETIQDLQSEINLKDSEIQIKINQISQKTAKLNKWKRAKKDLKNQLQQQQSKNSELTTTNQDYSQKLTNQDQQIVSQQKQIKKLLSEREQLLTQLETQKENVSPIQHQAAIKKIKTQLTAKEQEIKQISTRLEQLQLQKEQSIQTIKSSKQRQNWLLVGSGTIIFSLILLIILQKRKVKR